MGEPVIAAPAEAATATTAATQAICIVRCMASDVRSASNSVAAVIGV